jgi:hypothetical protein
MLSALTDDRTLLTDLFGLVLAARARLATFSVGVEKERWIFGAASSL